jgi:hypothetical protein
MNPFMAKDGSKHTNRDTMKRADARFGAGQPAAKAAPAADAGDGYNDGAEDQAQDGAAMAAEHGPAVETSIHHDHEAGKHSVHASHPDGHEHDSEHGSAAEAHQYASDCAGVGSGGGGMGGE